MLRHSTFSDWAVEWDLERSSQWQEEVRKQEGVNCASAADWKNVVIFDFEKNLFNALGRMEADWNEWT